MNGKDWLDLILMVGAWVGLLYSLYCLVLCYQLGRRLQEMLKKMPRGQGHD